MKRITALSADVGKSYSVIVGHPAKNGERLVESAVRSQKGEGHLNDRFRHSNENRQLRRVRQWGIENIR
jgi:hypothetical protein